MQTHGHSDQGVKDALSAVTEDVLAGVELQALRAAGFVPQ